MPPGRTQVPGRTLLSRASADWLLIAGSLGPSRWESERLRREAASHRTLAVHLQDHGNLPESRRSGKNRADDLSRTLARTHERPTVVPRTAPSRDVSVQAFTQRS